MSRLLPAKHALCENFPRVNFLAQQTVSVADKAGTVLAIICLDHNDEPAIHVFGLVKFGIAEIEAIIEYARAIDPMRPEGLIEDQRMQDPHNQH